jgi:hypothetical protein
MARTVLIALANFFQDIKASASLQAPSGPYVSLPYLLLIELALFLFLL